MSGTDVQRSEELILDVRDLATHFNTRRGTIRAVNGVSFSLRRGEILGLVGESGSGKSVTGMSIMGLISHPGSIAGGEILFRGRDLARISAAEMRSLRGNRIAMIFQDPMMTLNPVLRIETQMVETILAHDNVSRAEARSRARDALGMVGIPHPEERLSAYPHQFSGGMRQRVCIAIAMLHRPDLIVADEPTTALDVTIQAQILSVMQGLVDQYGTSLVWVSHDLSVVAGLADKVAVMYAGRIVEFGGTEQILDDPRHPYTLGLLRSVPSASAPGSRLRQIPGGAPSMLGLPAGCPFAPRCENRTPKCSEDPPAEIEGGRSYRCFNPHHLAMEVSP